MNKRIILVLSLLVVTSMLLAACGSGNNATEAPAGTDAPVTLRLWSHTNGAFNTGYDALIAAYMAEHPNVTIQRESFDYDLYIQTLSTAMPAGEEADLLQIFGTWTSQYYERLASAPTEVMSLDDANNLFYAAPIGGFTVDGKLYGLPQEFNMEYGGVLVNKTKFLAAGLTYPPEWKTMDDVVADGVKLAQKDGAGVMTTAGFEFTAADGMAFSFLAGIKQRGGDYWNADRSGFTFDTPEARAQLEWMVNAVNSGVVDPTVFNEDVNPSSDAFFAGKVAIAYTGAWAIADGLANYPDFKDEWDYMYLPATQGDPIFVADSGWGLSVSPNSKHQDVAWDFVKFATADPKNALAWNLASGTIPAMPGVAETAEIASKQPWLAGALDLLPYGEYLGNMPDRDLVVYEIIYPHLLEALQGVKTVDEALKAIDSEANSTFK